MIKEKRNNTIGRFRLKHEKYNSLLNEGRHEEAFEIRNNRESEKFRSHIFKKSRIASIEESSGKLTVAARLYWANIVENGSDIPNDFIRLMIICNKLKQPLDEYKAAKVYLHFASEGEIEKTKKRIVRIEKSLGYK